MQKPIINSNLIPRSKEKERLILGLILFSEGDLLSKSISMNHFYYDEHRRIFQSMLDLREQGLLINEMTITEQLKETNKHKDGDSLSIANLQNDIVYHQNFNEYMKYLEMYRRRRIAMEHIEKIICEPEKYSNKKIYATLQEVEKVIAQGDEIISSKELSEQSQKEEMRIFCGVPKIDKHVYFSISDYVIIGADPRRGKTSLALQMAKDMNPKYQPLFFSAEMSKYGIYQRMIAMERKIPLSKIREQWKEFKNYELESNHIHWCFTPRISTTQIAMQVSEAVNLYKTKVVIIDHIQLLRCDIPKGASYKRVDIVSDISSALNDIAKKYGVLLIACSQLNRDPERQKEKPGLRNLRDSGALEQDTDCVIMLWEHPTKVENTTYLNQEILVTKQRQGPEVEIKDVVFHKEIFLWT